MLLQERLINTGVWLFRWRSYLPLFFIVILIPAFNEVHYPFNSHNYNLVWEMLCLLISLFGLSIRCYTIGFIPKGTSGRNTKDQIADTLNTTGIYSIVRNPLYLGNFFMILGTTMFIMVWWVIVIYMLIFWLYYERIIMAEESFLIKKFGRPYIEYLQITPIFIPNFKLWKKSILTFSLKNVLKREYSGFFALISAFTILELAEDYVIKKSIILDTIWIIIFIFSLLVYLILRTLNRKTNLLHVEGR